MASSRHVYAGCVTVYVIMLVIIYIYVTTILELVQHSLYTHGMRIYAQLCLICMLFLCVGGLPIFFIRGQEDGYAYLPLYGIRLCC